MRTNDLDLVVKLTRVVTLVDGLLRLNLRQLELNLKGLLDGTLSEENAGELKLGLALKPFLAELQPKLTGLLSLVQGLQSLNLDLLSEQLNQLLDGALVALGDEAHELLAERLSNLDESAPESLLTNLKDLSSDLCSSFPLPSSA